MRKGVNKSKNISLLGLFLVMTLCLTSFLSSAQTISCTVLQQPCNNNGVLVTTVTGMTPPLEFVYDTYYYFSDVYRPGFPLTKPGVNFLSDTIRGLSDVIIRIVVTDANGNHVEMNNNSGMIAPFAVDAFEFENAYCPEIGNAKVTINGGAMPSMVQWYGKTANNLVGTGNPMNLPAGDYYTIITDFNGCTQSYDTVRIEYISGISFNLNKVDANCTNGSITTENVAGGQAPYTYQWSNGVNAPSINGLSSGSNSVTVTDANGCYSYLGSYINQLTSINVNSVVTNATCLQNNGSVISFGSGGTPPYTYEYSNGIVGQTASGLLGDAYMQVSVTDSKGCTGNGGFHIGTSTPIHVNYNSTRSSCTAHTGTATLNITGGTAPYDVVWGTSPVQTGITATSLPIGYWSYKVTDALGCLRTGGLYIISESDLYANIYTSNAICNGQNGAVSIQARGDNPPFTYSWSNGAASSSIADLTTGAYSCVVTDSHGCSVKKSAYVGLDSPIQIGFNTTPTSCKYSNDGSVLTNIYGGTPPYTYHWSSGQTTPSITDLETGSYSLFVQDANGCSSNNHTLVGYNEYNDNCFCTIKGKVYVDLNGNCQYDAGEEGVQNIMIHCSNFGYAFTDSLGNYSFKVPSGSYNLSEEIRYTYPLASCQNNNIDVNVVASSGCTSEVNFANIVNPIHDIHIIKTSSDMPVPGNDYIQQLIVQNDGTVSEANIKLALNHDGQLFYGYSSPSVFDQLSPVDNPNWYSSNSNVANLEPGNSTVIITKYVVPTNIPLATEINFSDTAAYISPMSNWLNDNSPWNNIVKNNPIVVGSFDPNFKEVFPKGESAQGYISTVDSLLDYVIHFQNTGTYYAQNIVVIDTLDSDLDINTLRLGYSDHSYTAELSEDRVLKLIFKNIHLIWEEYNGELSKGFVTYSIKQKKNLQDGTRLKSSAAIYFDYNAPVITNAPLNTIGKYNVIDENINASSDKVKVYPNPSAGKFKIRVDNFDNSNVSVKVFDLVGKVIYSDDFLSSDSEIDLGNQKNGLYFVQTQVDGVLYNNKIFVLK